MGGGAGGATGFECVGGGLTPPLNSGVIVMFCFGGVCDCVGIMSSINKEKHRTDTNLYFLGGGAGGGAGFTNVGVCGLTPPVTGALGGGFGAFLVTI